MEKAGEWLEKALLELRTKVETGIELDADIISGLVSYCQLATPLDAEEYLHNIIGPEASKGVIEEYLKRRGDSHLYNDIQDTQTSKLHAYVKPPSNDNFKKPQKTPKSEVTDNKPSQDSKTAQKANQASSSKKKKSGKVISLAEATKGSIVFQQGKACSCQARRHKLVSNCLCCGKIVCEQEGEGPCKFCGALVLKEGSVYAGLDEGIVPLTDKEAAAEAYAKRLVDYDRNSAARTTVIDDQSDYYNLEENNWLSEEEKELLRKKREEIQEDERLKRNRVVLTFDMVGRKVLLNEDKTTEELQNRILLEPKIDKEVTRVKPNPSVKIQPVFIDPGPRKKVKENLNVYRSNGLCLEISGRVQHETNDFKKVL